MPKTEKVSYRELPQFSPLIKAYLEQAAELRSLYHRFPSIEQFRLQIDEKRVNYQPEFRVVLREVLEDQYSRSAISLDASPVMENIRQLGNEETFTVTTGHQLNLFTGPLYFVYKILSVVNLCEKLALQYPRQRFVPIFWLASEDHDLEEVNHINFRGGRLRWPTRQQGAVGRMSTAGIEAVIGELSGYLGKGLMARQWCELLEQAYLKHQNMAQATRYLAHSLFGDYGLVVIDGDDARLKELAIPLFEKELKEHAVERGMKESSPVLDPYHRQVNPREINLFYLQDDSRERIVKGTEAYEVLNTDLRFKQAEFFAILKEHPERFSPNAVLRPVYQEFILPNLAYVGGGGEIAYWLQLRKSLERFSVSFPILLLRNSALLVPVKYQNRLSDLQIRAADLLRGVEQTKENLVREMAPVDPELGDYERRLQKMFDELEDLSKLTEKSMLGAVNAQRQKQLNGLNKLRKKLLRAEKRRHQTLMDKIDRIHQGLFPAGQLQERHDNLGEHFARQGEALIPNLKEALDPLDFSFTIFYEDSPLGKKI